MLSLLESFFKKDSKRLVIYNTYFNIIYKIKSKLK
nr:MAG TPA: hypothetical protein [Crassvirales sp.]